MNHVIVMSARAFLRRQIGDEHARGGHAKGDVL
jgi:hypothetical protein